MDKDELFSYSSDNSKQNSHMDLNSFSSGNANTVKKNDNKKKLGKENFLKIALTVILVGIITCSIVLGSFIVYVFTAVDGTMNEDLDNLKLNFTTTIYVKDKQNEGKWVEYQRLHGQFNRIWVSYDRKSAESNDAEYTGIPQNLIDAFVAIEDKRFFEHDGVDWKRTVSAFANLFLHFYDENQGGSTITQQLVKNLTGDASRKPSRKVREIMRARYLESKYVKDTIIECYLNTIAMGHGIYGVEVAANYYFDKSVNELTLLECASLASITKSPSNYAPDDAPDNNKKRRETVLHQMKIQGYITEEEYEAALAEEFKLVASKVALNETETNSYYIDALISQVTNDIAEKYGYESVHASTNFYSGGYKIYANLDPDIQNAIDSVFNDSATYALQSSDGQSLQGAFTIMDYEGRVLGMAGGIGEKTGNRGWNNAIDAKRQPGSTMKPIAAYAPAIEADMIHYSSIVNDVATNYNGWTPKNWYNGYWGNITVQYALERSVNSIPVYLVNKLTPQTCYDFLTENLGITTLNAEDINLAPLGMGGTNGGINTLESAGAYAVFGNGGLYYRPSLYTAVYDQKNEVVLSGESQPKMAISEDTATIMNHLLQNVVYGSQGTGVGAKSFIPNMKIFAKTGTSNDQNDLWFVGGSPYYVASCWCGFSTQKPIPKSDIALKMWGAVMSKVHSGLPEKEFEDSGYAVKKYYCTTSGDLATDACPSKEVGWYKKNSLPTICKTHTGEVASEPVESEVTSSETTSDGEQTVSTASSESN